MKIKKIAAKALKKVAKKNVDAACGIAIYQPEVPKALKKKSE